MSTYAPSQSGIPLVIQFGPLGKQLSEDEFFQFCQLNRDLRIERACDGELIVMPPTGAETGKFNHNIAVELGIWARTDGSGLAFDSSTGFALSNHAVRSPDLAWVRRSRWDKLTAKQKARFAPLCPDFVGEICSPSDRLPAVRATMQEYFENGAQLGWLIEPGEKRVYVYRPGKRTVRLDNPETLSGDPVLPGFALAIRKLWR
jgi:Uma2 family endonuclease